MIVLSFDAGLATLAADDFLNDILVSAPRRRRGRRWL